MHSSASIDAKLIDKYNALAPRYTSYPTAPQFHAQYGEDHYISNAQQSNSSMLPKDLSLYVHIPFCHSLCYFCGCNKVVTRTDNKKVNSYLERLLNETALRASHFNNDRLVTQIHFGGGTPNFLSTDQIAEILNQIAVQFHLSPPNNLEIGIELDPRSTSPSEIQVLADLGFNRFSIGVQDFSKEVQNAVNRQQDEAATLEVIGAAKKFGDSVNVDLITGLPMQSVESFAETLDKVIDSGVSRIAAYNFAYLPERIKAQRMIEPSSLPSAKNRAELTALARNSLLNAGYCHIGMDHYALPDDSLSVAQRSDTLQRNFQGYTTHRDTDLVGVGASAISKFDNAFSQNETSLSLYSDLIDSKSLPISKGIQLSDDDRIRAEVIQQIMCREFVDLNSAIGPLIEKDNHTKLYDYFQSELRQMDNFVDDGLIVKNSSGFNITGSGRYLLRSIAAVFDSYLTPPTDKQPVVVPFSRVI